MGRPPHSDVECDSDGAPLPVLPLPKPRQRGWNPNPQKGRDGYGPSLKRPRPDTAGEKSQAAPRHAGGPATRASQRDKHINESAWLSLVVEGSFQGGLQRKDYVHCIRELINSMGMAAPKNIIVHQETARQAYLKLPHMMCEELCNKVKVTEITGLAEDNSLFYKGDVALRLVSAEKFASQSSKRLAEEATTLFMSVPRGWTNRMMNPAAFQEAMDPWDLHLVEGPKWVGGDKATQSSSTVLMVKVVAPGRMANWVCPILRGARG